MEDPDVLFISETRLTEKELDRFRWSLGLTHMLVWDPVGRSRGIALFWRRGVEISLRSYGRRHIDVDVVEENGSVWRMTGVYGESAGERKKETWRTLKLLGQQHQDGRPWLCLGDFNEILTSDEKEGGIERPQACMDSFRESLERCGLCDIGFEGDKFTWSNHSQELNSYICERLDRATANARWCEAFPEFEVINSIPRHSDHRPIIVNTKGEGRIRSGKGDGSFRFEAWWLEEEGCTEEIQGAWEESWMTGEGGVARAMRRVAGRMRKWHKGVVGELEGRVKKARAELERCMRSPPSEHKVREEARLRCVLRELEEKKSIKAKQRSHITWLRKGNRNTRYFMSVVAARKKQNRLKMLRKEDGSDVKEGTELTNYVRSYFQELFTTNVEMQRMNKNGGIGGSSDAVGDLNKCTEDSWKRIWKLACPRNVQMFAWRIKHESLALLTNMQRRGFQLQTTRCFFCGLADEDGAHLFVKCKMVKEVWRELALEKERINLEAITDVHAMMDYLWGLDECKRLHVLTFWWLWWSYRNKVRQGELPSTPAEVARRTRSSVLEYRQIYAPGTKKISADEWKPPGEGVVKFNLDGSFTPGDQHVGWGVAARTSDGDLVAARAGRQEYISDPFGAEVIAMANAVALAADLDVVQPVFETDSQLLMEALDLRKADSSPYAAVIEDTKFQLKMWFSKYELGVCRRTANSVAHELANVGRMYPVNHLLDFQSDVPAQVAACVSGDKPEHR
ncbi:Elongation factor 1-alpha [Hordeum vulgare]|nr:Elongation factor 1-alpha [Hordeum vulgare]